MDKQFEAVPIAIGILFPDPSFDCAQDDIGWKNSLLIGIQKILPFRVRVKGFSASN